EVYAGLEQLDDSSNDGQVVFAVATRAASGAAGFHQSFALIQTQCLFADTDEFCCDGDAVHPECARGPYILQNSLPFLACNTCGIRCIKSIPLDTDYRVAHNYSEMEEMQKCCRNTMTHSVTSTGSHSRSSEPPPGHPACRWTRGGKGTSS